MFGRMTKYFKRFNIKCETVLHLGAHYGEEDAVYEEFGVEPIYVEACPSIFQILQKNIPHRKMHNVAISDKPGKARFFLANNHGLSNSLLDMDQHQVIYPKVGYTGEIEVSCTTVDLLVKENDYHIDTMCLDIQGAELMAFQGATETLKSVNVIFIEIGLVPLYKNAPILPDIDEYLNRFGFKRVLTTLEASEWGDALYIKKEFLKKIRRNLVFDPDPSKIVQISGLVNNKTGRFGNQLFQYATAKGYCQTYGYTLEIPENWIGRKIFKNINDNIIKESLPNYTARECPNGEYGIDLGSMWWFNQNGISVFTRQQVKQWFVFKDEYKISPDQTYKIVCHLRRGDFARYRKKFTQISKRCYRNAVKEYGYDYKDVHFTEEKISTKGYNEWIKSDPCNFLHDFQTIQNADVIFRANSTFSWWAAVLSNAKIFSPVVGDTCGWQDNIKFVPGNHPLIAHTKNHSYNWFSDLYLWDFGEVVL